MVPLKISLPDHFLDEEERCGYVVSHEKKKVWAVMLDLLAEFDRVCQKHGIKYFASGGTMLGAVRHKGFIPWDDDMDVMMFRKDYNKLCEIGPEEFRQPYFFQNKQTDPFCGVFMSKLRNSNTAALARQEMDPINKTSNRGIFIDIFPLDNIPDAEEERETFLKSLNEERLKVYQAGRRIGIFSEDIGIRHFIKKFKFHFYSKRRKNELYKYINAYNSYNSLCQKYLDYDTEMFASLQFQAEKKHFKYISDYEKCVMMDFEFLKIPVGLGYDHALKLFYGDYMKCVQYPHHSCLFDTDNSYKDYL